MPPVFQYAMIVLNRKPHKTSWFHVKGANFTATSKVLLNGQECDRTKCISPTLLAAAVKFASWPVALPAVGGGAPAPATGELDVTITVKDGADLTVPALVTVVEVNEDDLA
jgi:hypothetical protein